MLIVLLLAHSTNGSLPTFTYTSAPSPSSLTTSLRMFTTFAKTFAPSLASTCSFPSSAPPYFLFPLPSHPLSSPSPYINQLTCLPPTLSYQNPSPLYAPWQHRLRPYPSAFGPFSPHQIPSRWAPYRAFGAAVKVFATKSFSRQGREAVGWLHRSGSKIYRPGGGGEC